MWAEHRNEEQYERGGHGEAGCVQIDPAVERGNNTIRNNSDWATVVVHGVQRACFPTVCKQERNPYGE